MDHSLKVMRSDPGSSFKEGRSERRLMCWVACNICWRYIVRNGAEIRSVDVV